MSNGLFVERFLAHCKSAMHKAVLSTIKHPTCQYIHPIVQDGNANEAANQNDAIAIPIFNR